MKRELDTRKESNDVFGRPLESRETRGAVVPSAAAGLAMSAMAPQATLVDKALAFVQSQPAAFGFAPGEPAEFVPDPTVQHASSGAAAVHIHQHYHGLPVFGMARTVRFSTQGDVIDAAGASAAIPPGLSTEPALSAIDAVNRVAAHLAASGGEIVKDKFGQESQVPTLQVDG